MAALITTTPPSPPVCLVASDMAERSLSELNSPANIAADGDGRARVLVGRAKGEMSRQLRRRLVVQRMLCAMRKRGHWYHWVEVAVGSTDVTWRRCRIVVAPGEVRGMMSVLQQCIVRRWVR